MIRNDREYAEAVQRLREEEQRLQDQKAALVAMGLDADEVRRALEPFRSFHLHLQEEVDHFEPLRRGDVGALENLHGLGQMLIGLRIARGLSQRKLASLLGVHESQVSRDERNEYHGLTVERASRILDALQVRLDSRIEAPVLPAAEEATAK
jgi:DNA-directed RNA polymerase specialized sigma subunit